MNEIAGWLDRYRARQIEVYDALPLDQVAGVVDLLHDACERGAEVFVFGNGGSGNASHFATDLGKGASDVTPKRFRVLSLNDNSAWMTAIGNDYSFEDVFVRQLQNYARPGDLALCMSVSGGSPNLVRAVTWARENGLATVAMVGGRRGRLAEAAEHVLVIPDTHYGRVEDAQMTVCHMLAYAFMERAGAQDLRGPGAWGVELSAPLEPRPEVSHVLFDFDGTLSLIRQGWPEVMVPMFAEALPRRPGETDDAVRSLVLDDIMRLNGKQTIYQMIQLADRVRERGGEPLEPLAYKHEYLRRLDAHVGSRTAALRAGSVGPDEHLVHAARPLLEHLRDRGLTLYLASGTDEYAVKQEAELLDVAKYFGPHIYGALDDYKSFSKKMVIDRLLRENGVTGRRLLSFGDGYVEIENTKQVGGFAVAVASDEAHNGSGRVDEWKRRRLLSVGADAVIPDYRDAVALVDGLLGLH